ncbi:MAG: PKD domain-containing protein [Bacteroidales bacterium]|nr:PKD domain-containing protein [Bacteroidales bacterium]
MHSSGRFYFSSRGHGSRGGLDIFYTDMQNGEWKDPIAMPDPFNSREDDFGLIFNNSLDTAFMCSKRSSGTMDIFIVYSTLPVFTNCPQQQENDYCYVFFDEGMIDLDTTSFKYEWDMGDGTKIRGKEAEHCFKNPGDYTIILNVIDTLTGDVSYNEASYDFTVEQIQQVYITAPDTAVIDQELELKGTDTYLPDINIDKYYWDFGDGAKSVNPLTKHAYSKPGTYTIQLGVTSKVNDESIEPEKHCVNRTIVILKR